MPTGAGAELESYGLLVLGPEETSEVADGGIPKVGPPDPGIGLTPKWEDRAPDSDVVPTPELEYGPGNPSGIVADEVAPGCGHENP